ncbi:MAG: RHS repeat-associated core domain-containing protein, partial [Phycisphaerales bacterium]
EASGTNNMVKTSELTFDGGSAGGNSHVTTRTSFIQDSATGQRQTTYTHDFRGRVLLSTNAQAPHTLVKVDNLGRVTAAAQYTSTGSITVGTTDPGATGTQSNRVALSKTAYDELGRAWKTTRYKIDQADGSDDDLIDSLTWYDPAGRVMKVKGESAHQKYAYDRLGRRTRSFDLATDDDTQYGHASASTAVWDSDDNRTNLAGDIVLEEHQTAYESDDSDNVLMTVSIRRNHNDLANGTTGELDDNADGGTPTLLTLTAADVTGRVDITAMWYDTQDRMTDTVRYGTNAGSTFTRGSLSVPTRSDTALRTTTVYNDNGTTLEIEAPGLPSAPTGTTGAKTRFEYDALFRQTKVISNYVNGTPGDGTGDDDQTVIYGYSKALRTSITADLPTGSTDQVTTYIYGSTKGTPSAMKIATGHLLRAVKYPDSSNGGTTVANIDSDSSDVVSHAYNAQGQMTYSKDQAGNVIQTSYDTAGRETARDATVVGGFDDHVFQIATSYLSRGLIDTVTQHGDDGGTQVVRDQVQYAYDDWGNLTTFTQDPDSAISGGSGRDPFPVTFSYEKAAPSGARSVVRRTGVTLAGDTSYPASYSYLSSGNRLDDAASRVTRVVSNAVTLAEYGYAGSGTLISTDLAECNARTQSSDAVAYDRLDRFDRVITQVWEGSSNQQSYDRAGKENIYSVAIAYDRNSNIVSVLDSLRTSGGTRVFDALYGLDNLNRLIQTDEGELTSGITTRSRYEQWTLDQVGNWSNHKVDLNGDKDYLDNVPPQEFQEDRTHNVVNELTDRDQDTNATAGYENAYNLAYDAVGNLADDGEGYTYIYDAFGRLRKVLVDIGGTTYDVVEHRYNGLGYRIGYHYDVDTDVDVDDDDPWYWHAYDERWRIIGTYYHDPNTAATDDDAPKERFVYHAAGFGGYGGSSYIDSVILRDKDANTSWEAASDGTLEERRYYCQNWRADVSAVLTDAGKLVESVKYSSYGVAYGLPTGDTDSDGDYDATDAGAIGGGGYNVLEDADLDGDNDAADATFASAVVGGYQTLGRGTLSSTGVQNRKGYAGYEMDPVMLGSKYHARHSVYSAVVGRWIRRDRAGYGDGPNLHQYVKSAPIVLLDPLGLASTVGGGPIPRFPRYLGCAMSTLTRQECEACCQRVFTKGDALEKCLEACKYRPPVYTPPLPGTPGTPEERHCEEVCKNPDTHGGVTCVNGQLIVCICDQNISIPSVTWNTQYRKCVLRHEGINWRASQCNPNPNPGQFPVVPKDPWICAATCNEAEAYEDMVRCVQEIDCGGDAVCEEKKAEVLKRISPRAQDLRNRCEECRQRFPR